MFDLGWSELLVIGVVALIVVGPKDLPVLFRNIGRFVGKAKGMAREFSRAMNDAADDAGVGDLQKSLKAATNPIGTAMDGVKDAAKSMTDINKMAGNSGSDTKTSNDGLSPEREAQRKKIEASTARMAADRKKREADEAMRKAEEMEAALKPDDSPASAPKGDA